MWIGNGLVYPRELAGRDEGPSEVSTLCVSGDGRDYGASVSVTALSKLASASTRTIGRSSAEWYGAKASSGSERCEAAIPTLPIAGWSGMTTPRSSP
jgi:hypothetical protein